MRNSLTSQDRPRLRTGLNRTEQDLSSAAALSGTITIRSRLSASWKLKKQRERHNALFSPHGPLKITWDKKWNKKAADSGLKATGRHHKRGVSSGTVGISVAQRTGLWPLWCYNETMLKALFTDQHLTDIRVEFRRELTKVWCTFIKPPKWQQKSGSSPEHNGAAMGWGRVKNRRGWTPPVNLLTYLDPLREWRLSLSVSSGSVPSSKAKTPDSSDSGITIQTISNGTN